MAAVRASATLSPAPSNVRLRAVCHTDCKRAGLSPDGTVQMVYQLAYYRLHGHVAPTYESCNMQHFHHGRTETIRSATLGTARPGLS